MNKVDVSLIQQGSFVHVAVDYMGKKATKELKVCRIKARSILLIEVDKPNRKNIFRKVNLKDIALLTPTQLHVKKDILPTKWESAWDSIGQPTHTVQIRGRGLASQFTKHFSNHSKGWAPKLPSTTYTNGFPMV